VVEALDEMCPAIAPDQEELTTAIALADEHDLSLYDAADAAVARQRGAHLATMDEALLSTGLAQRPSTVAALVKGPTSTIGTRSRAHAAPATDPLTTVAPFARLAVVRGRVA
jgi:hypothetical protein